ncbi:MAG: FkbM family methyltransferase [Candidatus Babeliales bacterium]
MNKQTLNRPLLKNYVPENAIIVEAGAHKGRDTLKLHALFPHAHIYAFEPVPYLYEQLQKAVAGIPSITIFNSALSSETGTTTMHVSPELGAVSSLLEPTTLKQEKPTITFQEITVPTITLDDWACNNKLEKIDFLWLDLQGQELTVLKAAPEILKTVHTIYTEATLEARYKNQTLYPELKSFLEHNGFHVVAEHFHHETWGNVLFSKK